MDGTHRVLFVISQLHLSFRRLHLTMSYGFVHVFPATSLWQLEALLSLLPARQLCELSRFPIGAGLDVDGNGSLERAELREVCAAGGMQTEEELDKAIAELEGGAGNNDGVVSFAEFASWCGLSRT